MSTRNIQKLHLLKDIDDYGNEDRGIYKEFSWRMERNTHGKNWCGYISISNLTIDERGEMETNLHWGITFESDSEIGFDCAHCYDYSIWNGEGIYRDHTYVFNIIKNGIDKIRELRNL